MRIVHWLIVIGAMVLGGCSILSRPTPLPTATPFVPTPPTVFTPSFSDKSVQLAWFYKPPEDENLATLVHFFDFFILTNKDEDERNLLRAQGVTVPFLQYLRLDAIYDPGSCQNAPRGNQVAYEAGDYCRISEQHPDWFLLDVNGNRIYENDYAFMDPGNPEWREFFLERARRTQEQLGWDGVFLDNAEASLSKRVSQSGLPAAYPEDASYQAAVEDFLKYLYTGYFQPRRRPMFANIVALENPSVWFRYLQYLDGAMEESFAVDWADGYLHDDEWQEHLSRAEATQGLGKRIILVAQGARDDLQREQFAFASYLLATDGAASFRYTSNHTHAEAWIYSNYLLDLGDPLGPRYYDGVNWRRDFSKGSVSVDLKSHTATIATR